MLTTLRWSEDTTGLKLVSAIPVYPFRYLLVWRKESVRSQFLRPSLSPLLARELYLPTEGDAEGVSDTRVLLRFPIYWYGGGYTYPVRLGPPSMAVAASAVNESACRSLVRAVSPGSGLACAHRAPSADREPE
jgi:hypothetical protein